MGKQAQKIGRDENSQQRRNDLPRKDKLNGEERNALEKLRRGARQEGSFLSSGGKGGLPPSLVLHCMRRDKYRCKTCGELGNQDNGGIGVHHKGGIVESKWLSKQGHSNTPANIVSICASCHDKEHQKAKAEGVDSSQVTPEGDKGNPRRDKGLPDADPKS